MLLSGCSSADVETTQDAKDTAETPAAESSETVEETVPVEEEEELFPKLTWETPEKDYEGYEFHILTRGWAPAKDEMGTDELTGETVNDEVYNRNLSVGAKYNMTVTRYYNETTEGHGPANVKTMVQAGDKSADMIVGSLFGMMPLTTDKLFYD